MPRYILNNNNNNTLNTLNTSHLVDVKAIKGQLQIMLLRHPGCQLASSHIMQLVCAQGADLCIIVLRLALTAPSVWQVGLAAVAMAMVLLLLWYLGRNGQPVCGEGGGAQRVVCGRQALSAR